MKAEYLMNKEMEKVLALLTPANELIMRVCLHTGLRITDVLSLKPPIKTQFWVVETKTKKKRRVNLTRELADKLNAFSGKYYVFPNRRNPKRHRTRQAVWLDVKRAAKAFRLPVNVSVHSARKIYAVDKLHESKGDMKKVQSALNHEDEATSMIYAMAESLYNSKYEEVNGRVCKKGKKSKG